MFNRMLSLVCALSLLLTPTALFAKDTPVYCGDLNKNDCRLLEEADDVMDEVASISTNTQVLLEWKNLPDIDPKNATVEIEIDRQHYIEPAWYAALSDLVKEITDLVKDDPEATLDDQIDELSDILGDLKLDLSISVSFSKELAKELASGTEADRIEDFTLYMRMLDGVFYVDPSELRQTEADEELPDGWVGVDILEELDALKGMTVEEVLDEVGSSDMLELLGFLRMALDTSDDEATQELINRAYILERGDDSEINDTTVAQIITTIDFAALFTDPEIQDAILTRLEEGDTDIGIDPGEVAMMLTLVAPMFTQGLEYESSQQIDPESGYILGSESFLSWDLTNLVRVLKMMGINPEEKLNRKKKPLIELTITNQGANFDEEVDLEAPEDAKVKPLSEW